jgi:hypothetical protein
MASTSVSVRLPDEIMEKLEAQAKAEGIKVSDVVRGMIESGFKPGVNLDSSGISARIDKLEESIRALLGVEDVSVLNRLDAVNADIWQANEALIGYLAKSAAVAAEAKYFARLAAMFGLDIAHYVAQKVEIGKVPEPLSKDTKENLVANYDQYSKKYAAEFLAELS